MNEELDMQAQIAFQQALAAVQPVAKTQEADTGKYKYRYADLGDVLDECKRVCELFGLTISQIPMGVDGHLALKTLLLHKDGGAVVLEPLVMKLPNDPQAYGSALTYARRYALLSIFGIATEDDDGAEATRAARAPQQHGGYRTPAEQRIHAELAMLSEDDRRTIQALFRSHFNSTLSGLTTNRHGDALTWVLAQIQATKAEAPSADDAADAAWVADASG